MKIASITTSPMPTSTAHSIQAIKVTQALAQVSGAEVQLWVPGRESATWEVLAQNYGLTTPFPVNWLPANPAFKRYDFTWKAVQAARAWGADLIYTWTIQAAWLAGRYGLPVVQEMHDIPMGRFGPWFFRWFAESRTPHRILCTTHALRQRLEAQLGHSIADPQALIAPNGTDMDRYRDLPQPSAARATLEIPEKFTVVYSGHFYPGRGMDLLLDLARAFPDMQFLWLGGKPKDVEPWREKLRAEGVNNVRITGFIENSRLPLYQAVAEVLVMPYRPAVSDSGGGNIVEVFNPMKMFDYLAAGRAIISSDLPVLHEILNQENALFARADDSSDWIHKLGLLVQDAELRSRLAAQAAADAPQYDWRVRAERALSVTGLLE
jgi:glycosyltransferase involved in cell wall biosynthesis